MDRLAKQVGRYAFNAMLNENCGRVREERRVEIMVDGRYRDERKERRFKKIELESKGYN